MSKHTEASGEQRAVSDTCGPRMDEQAQGCSCGAAPGGARERPVCCSGVRPPADAPWVEGPVSTPVGAVPRVASSLARADRLGAIRARLGIGRMHYAVTPGLYALGSPSPDSPVLVSANYKLSFDHVRSAVPGRDAWIMVLDTKGINVWCAAGKGTFGTDEIVGRIEATRLAEVVSHRKLVLPQLGAPGVAAHEVRGRSGFRVIYGPVRARDIGAFLDAGMKATPEMRAVTFTLRERLVLVPLEFVMAPKWLLAVLAVVFLLGGLSRDGYSWHDALRTGGGAALLMLVGFVAGAGLVPTLLPWLPGRAFSVKGAVAGLVPALAWAAARLHGGGAAVTRLDILAWLLIVPAVSAFFALNFTGASTYTSLSGVKVEMRVAVPAQAAAALIGFGFWIAARFV